MPNVPAAALIISILLLSTCSLAEELTIADDFTAYKAKMAQTEAYRASLQNICDRLAEGDLSVKAFDEKFDACMDLYAKLPKRETSDSVVTSHTGALKKATNALRDVKRLTDLMYRLKLVSSSLEGEAKLTVEQAREEVMKVAAGRVQALQLNIVLANASAKIASEEDHRDRRRRLDALERASREDTGTEPAGSPAVEKPQGRMATEEEGLQLLRDESKAPATQPVP